jgi:hypothetical protein
MPTPASSNHCLRYGDLADHIRIDDAIALWCGFEPAELAKLNFETQCLSAKRAQLKNMPKDVLNKRRVASVLRTDFLLG